ncbi:MAG: hypothetical protein IT520_18280 [Burkholderiales bacterium]|nr:hypothetical protein [Burkholderiales bacterium]
MIRFAQRTALLFALAATAALAHEGHDHGDSPAPQAVAATLAPRATAATDAFEVVAILENAELSIYVDRYATNEPVVRAQVDVEGGGVAGVAAERVPGVYTIAAGALRAGARVPLTISIDAASASDLVALTLDVPAAAPKAPVPAVAEASNGRRDRAIVAGLVALAIVAAALWLFARARTRKAPDAH